MEITEKLLNEISKDCGDDTMKANNSYIFSMIRGQATGYTKQEIICKVFDNNCFYYGTVGKSHFRLIGFCVGKSMQGTGLSKKIFQDMLEECRKRQLGKITLRCHLDSPAMKYWEHMGAIKIGLSKDGKDAEMTLETGTIPHNYASPRWTGEIADCSLPVTFDTYSNCSFGCVYCFSQYQRGIGAPKEKYFAKNVTSVNPEKIKKMLESPEHNQFWDYLKDKRPIQWGGLSDEFDNFEKKYGVTLELLKIFKEHNYPICFSTKGTWWLYDERYRELFRGQDNWNVKFSIITLDPENARKIEVGVPSPQERIDAIREYTKLNKGGATLRLRPFIIGVTSKDYLELIKQAHDAGATAVTTEFFCMEQRAMSQAKEHYDVISECCGFDIVDFYKKYSSGTGYLRLNRKIKEKYVRKMRELCDKLGMRFYVSDAHFKEVSDNGCCCALPPEWEYSRGNFSYALQVAKRKGEVRWTDIEHDMYFLDGFQWYKAQGFNTNSAERRAKFHGMTMKDYLRYLWNNPIAGQSPFTMFGGVLKPNGKDENDDIIYVYDESKTFQNCIGDCGCCTEHGFIDVVQKGIE